MPDWVDLRMKCPVPIGPGRDQCPWKDKAHYWIHADCGGYLYISNDRPPRIRCEECYTSSSWENWSFACTSHPLRYCQSNYKDFISALGLAVNLEYTSEDKKNLVKEIMNIMWEEMMKREFYIIF